jgi:hypothetical protein
LFHRLKLDNVAPSLQFHYRTFLTITSDSAPVSTPFGVLKTDPGAISLASVLKELDKLKRLSTLALPADLFTGVPPKVLQTYRLRAAAEPPREMRMHPEAIRYALLGAFCWQRRQEIMALLCPW